jgi:hypothetical protein
MANPTAHEVQNLSSRREELSVQLRDGGDRAVVYMCDDPGRSVEFLVRRLVGAPESLLWNLRQLLASLWPLTTSLTSCSFVPVACDIGAGSDLSDVGFHHPAKLRSWAEGILKWNVEASLPEVHKNLTIPQARMIAHS